MTRTIRRARIAAALAVPALLGSVALAGEAGLSINWTGSVPPGLYWASASAPKIGELVKVCPPDREPFRTAKRRGYFGPGPCAGDYQPLIKRLLAAKGDRVTIAPTGVAINGALLPNSAPRAKDTEGRPLPQIALDRVLRDGEAFVMTDYPNSFDGRYTGPVELTNVISRTQPIVTWAR